MQDEYVTAEMRMDIPEQNCGNLSEKFAWIC